MKKLFSILLSLQLIIAPVAMAKDADISAAAATAASSTGMGTNTYDKAVEEGGYDFYIKQVLILALSSLGANILTACPKGIIMPSIALYMAGSITYIISEIAGAKAENNRHKQAIGDIKMDVDKMPKEGNEMQKKMLTNSRDEQQATLEYIQKKRNWMIAITTIYTAAMAAAIIEEFYGRAAQAAAYGNVVAYDSLVKAECRGISVAENKILNGAIIMAIMLAWGFAASQIDGSGLVSTIGSALLGLAMMFSDTVSGAVVATYQYPIPRAINFGVHAAVGGTIISGLVIRENKAQKNIENLDKVIADFKTLEMGGLNLSTGEYDDSAAPSQKNGKVARLNKGEKNESPCFNAQRKISSKGGCADPFVRNGPGMNFNGDPTINSVHGQSQDLANALNAGNFERADAIAGDIASKAGSVRTVLEKLKKKYNEKLKAEGKKPVEFDKEIKKQMAQHQATMNNSMAAKGMPTADISKATVDLDSLKTDTGLAGATNGSNGGAAAPAPAAPGLDLGMDDELSELTNKDSIAKSGEGIDQYETEEADISKAKDVPIWTQLTNRYILNYNKIFERNRPAVAVPTPESTQGSPSKP